MRDNDSSYSIRKNLSWRIYSELKKNNLSKVDLFLDYLGCTIQQLKEHLENKFQEGMNWDNYEQFGWHIDHIRPCASFDLTDPEQQKQCFHFTNLQPLWWFDNIKKGNKYSP